VPLPEPVAARRTAVDQPAPTAPTGPAQSAPPGLDQPVAVTELVDRLRTDVRRLTPREALAATRAGALLVDTRTESQRAEQGELPGAVVVDRTVLEWRLDPTSPDRIREATGHDVHVVLVCRQGYSSSLAVASLRALGLWRATDVIGGVEAWAAAGLPLHRGPADVRR
jgi:rhodanese-related sulfurtransferase